MGAPRWMLVAAATAVAVALLGITRRRPVAPVADAPFTLQLRVDRAFVIGVPETDQAQELFVHAAVANDGPPTGVRACTVAIAGDRVFRSGHIPPRIVAERAADQAALDALGIVPAGALLERLGARLPSGGRAEGWLRFNVRGTRREAWRPPAPVAQLACEDDAGAVHRVALPVEP